MSAATPLDRVLALAAIPELADLAPDDLASLASRAEERRFAPGEVEPVEDASTARFLLAGSVEVGSTRRRVEAPAVIGAVETLVGVELPARPVGEGVQVLSVEREAFLGILEDVFEVWLALMRHTAARLVAAEDVVAEPRVQRAPDWRGRELGASLVSRIVLLGACEVFRRCRVHARGRLGIAMEEIDLSAGAVLWEPGQRACECYAVLAGSLESEGRDHRARRRHGPGAVVGLREVLAALPRSGRVAAPAGARVLRLADEALIDELEDDPEMAAVFLAALAERTLRAERTSSPQEGK